MSDIFKAAVIQAAPALFDTPKTVAKLADLTRDVAGKGARLVVFPEARSSGAIPKASISGRSSRNRTGGSEPEPAMLAEPKEDTLCSD